MANPTASKPQRLKSEDGKAGAEEVSNFLLCNTDYEHTQSTKAGAPGVDPGQLITESRLFPAEVRASFVVGIPSDRSVCIKQVLIEGEAVGGFTRR